MPNSIDWFPKKRELQLAMAKNWITVAGANKVKWKIPDAELTDLADLTIAAEEALALALSSDRTPTITARCKAAFEALEAKMRYIKSHYFLVPPLTDADLVSLGLKPHDTIRTEVPVPKDLPGLEVTKWAPHTLGFRRFVATDLGTADSDYGVRVYYALVDTAAARGSLPAGQTPGNPASGELHAIRLDADVYRLSAPPKVPEDLPNSFFTRRTNDLLQLPTAASGMTCYLAACFENDTGKSGQFGPMIQAVVP
jgi:hypothetical protein